MLRRRLEPSVEIAAKGSPGEKLSGVGAGFERPQILSGTPQIPSL